MIRAYKRLVKTPLEYLCIFRSPRMGKTRLLMKDAVEV